MTDYLRDQGFSEPREKASLLIQQLRERNFILCYRGADTYGFMHRTFLEYFCAVEIVHRFEKQRTLTFEQLRDEVFGQHWQDEAWHEVLRLVCRMVDVRFTYEVIDSALALENYAPKNYTEPIASCIAENRNFRILLIDDHEENRLVLSILLNSVGFDQIDEAANGFEGNEKLENQKYDIIFTDLEMPDLSGDEMLIKAQKRWNNKSFLDRPYVVILSSTIPSEEFSDSRNRFQLNPEQVEGFLAKPIEPKELINHIIYFYLISEPIRLRYGETKVIERLTRYTQYSESLLSRRLFLKLAVNSYPTHPKTTELLQDRAVNDPDKQLQEWAKQQLKIHDTKIRMEESFNG